MSEAKITVDLDEGCVAVENDFGMGVYVERRKHGSSQVGERITPNEARSFAAALREMADQVEASQKAAAERKAGS